MKSSDPQRLAGMILALTAIGLAALVIQVVRPRLADEYHRLRSTSDVYALPSPEQTVVLSLGYRAALADVIFGHVLVAYGLHFEEKRRVDFMGEYLDTINALDPKFRDPYYFADTLLTMQPETPRTRDYLKAREVLDRGLEQLPYDAELWSSTGQWFAYVSWPYVPEDIRQEWRNHGAKILARACELVGDDQVLPYHCITAASLFNRLGQHEAMIRFLERVLLLADDPKIRQMAEAYLAEHAKGRAREVAQRQLARFEEARSADLPFVSRGALLVIGPKFDPAACAGADRAGAEECVTSWRRWHATARRK